VFFLTSIPGYANQSAPPVTYEQAKAQELLRELKLDQGSLLSYELKAQRNEVLSEFADVRAYLESIPYTAWTQETMQKAMVMVAERMDENKAQEYAEKLGITPKAISCIRSIITDIDKWLKEHPYACGILVAFVVCVVVGIVLLILTLFAPAVSLILSILFTGAAMAAMASIVAILTLKICGTTNSDFHQGITNWITNSDFHQLDLFPDFR
jgi:ElaB/YqjD/DUF883 family membrane-anchored ribosome-binding protein